MTAIERLDELNKTMEAARKKIREEGQAAFRAACDDVFAQHPKLESFSWPQYSPFFNDGEPCEFSVHELDGMKFDGVEWNGYELGVSTYGYVQQGTKKVTRFNYRTRRDETVEEPNMVRAEHEPRLSCNGDDETEVPEGFDMKAAIAAFEAVEPILAFLQKNEDIAEVAFGNHVRVTVTRQGFDTDSYDHD